MSFIIMKCFYICNDYIDLRVSNEQVDHENYVYDYIMDATLQTNGEIGIRYFDIISQLACDKKDDVSPVKILEYHFGICVERH